MSVLMERQVWLPHSQQQQLTNKLVFTAGANGSYIKKLRFQAIGTNVASVARIYINNGSTNGTATNNSFYGQVSLPATTATQSAFEAYIASSNFTALKGSVIIFQSHQGTFG